MPNYCTVTIQTLGEHASAALDFMQGRDTDDTSYAFDFNNILPMPASIKAMEASFASELNELIYQHQQGIDTPRLSVEAQRHNKTVPAFLTWAIQADVYDAVMGKQAYENRITYGSANWYDWAKENWGTKWNACNAQRFDNTVTFDCAWCAPEPVLIALSQRFPRTTFDIDVHYGDAYAQIRCINGAINNR